MYGVGFDAGEGAGDDCGPPAGECTDTGGLSFDSSASSWTATKLTLALLQCGAPNSEILLAKDTVALLQIARKHNIPLEQPEGQPTAAGSPLQPESPVALTTGRSFRPCSRGAPAEAWRVARWEELGGGAFEDLLMSGAIRLLSAEWLVACAAADGRLLPRQRLPEEAYLTFDELRAATPATSMSRGRAVDWLPIVFVSHIWLTPSSPDPHGHTLRLVCCALRTMLATELAPAIGVFVCVSSMLQSDPVLGLERSAADESLFEAALRGLPLLCGHPHTWVLRVTTFPDDYPAAYSIPLGANVAKPEARGWLQAEAAWVSMKPSGDLVLDLGKLDGSEADFASMFRKCGAARRPPPRPAELAARLEHAKFTDGCVHRI